jgi:hypothetical protein
VNFARGNSGRRDNAEVKETVLRLLAWIFLALVISLGVVPAWDQADEKAKLVEGAKREGKLIGYTSTNGDRVEAAARRLRKQYPVIKGEIFRSSRRKPGRSQPDDQGVPREFWTVEGSQQ